MRVIVEGAEARVIVGAAYACCVPPQLRCVPVVGVVGVVPPACGWCPPPQLREPLLGCVPLVGVVGVVPPACGWCQPPLPQLCVPLLAWVPLPGVVPPVCG